MKSFLKSVVQRKEGLVGRTLKVGAYTVRVEAHLADGGFAAIYRVRDQAGPASYALKHIRIAGDPEARADCMTEIEVMKRLRGHPNVLTLRAVELSGARDAEEALLLLDLCQDSLVDHLRAASWRIPMGEVATVFHSVARAVALMHHQPQPLAHRDLKAENVLRHTSGAWVLCDFGSTTHRQGVYSSADAIMVAEDQIRKHTTPAYRAPEMYDLYSREPVGIAADLWALGVLLYFMCAGKLPFQGECKLQVLNGSYAPLPLATAPALRRLVQDLLTVRVAQRPTIDEVLRRMEEMTSMVELPPAQGDAGPPPASPRASTSHSLRSGSPEPDAAFQPMSAGLPSFSHARGPSEPLEERGPPAPRSAVQPQQAQQAQQAAAPLASPVQEDWSAGGWATDTWEAVPQAPAPAVAPAPASQPSAAALAPGPLPAPQPQKAAAAGLGASHPPPGAASQGPAGAHLRRASDNGVAPSASQRPQAASGAATPSTSQRSLAAGPSGRRVAAHPPPPPLLQTPQGAARQEGRGEKLRQVQDTAADFLQLAARKAGAQPSGVPDGSAVTPRRASASGSAGSAAATPIPALVPPPRVHAPAPRVTGDGVPSHPISMPAEEAPEAAPVRQRSTRSDSTDAWANLGDVPAPAPAPEPPGPPQAPPPAAPQAPSGGSQEEAALRRQLAELQAENAQLKGTVRRQGQTIMQLQADNHQLTLSQQRPLEPEEPGSRASTASPEPWASFGSGGGGGGGYTSGGSGVLTPKGEGRQRPPTSPTRGASGIPLGSLRRRAEQFQPLVEMEPSSATTLPMHTLEEGGFAAAGPGGERGPHQGGAADTLSLLGGPPQGSSEPRNALGIERIVGARHRRTTSEPTPLDSWNFSG